MLDKPREPLVVDVVRHERIVPQQGTGV
jgi:hypothetical protein